jgi:poly(hydroxyalkanoate) depolymerase family esterase
MKDKATNPMVQLHSLETMTQATRLVREGKLAEASALLQGRPIASPVEPGAARAAFQQRRPKDARRGRGTLQGTLSGSAGLEDLLARLRQKSPLTTPTQPEPKWPGRWLDGSYASSAGQRDYRLYVPSGYAGKPVPLITLLHGGTQTADDFAAGTRMNEIAERHTLLVVYPEQSVAANPMRYWNWFQPTHQHRGTGEPALIAGLTSQIVAEYRLERERVYVAGFSAGAAMAAVMAACYPELYAAVGVHSGLAYGAAKDVASAFRAMKHGTPPKRHGSGSVPLIVFHGDADPTVDHVNADCLVEGQLASSGERSSRSRNQTRTGQVPGGRGYSCSLFTDADGRAAVEQWTIHQGAHAWAGGSPNGSYTDPLGPDASAEFVRFFLQHRLDAGAGRPIRRRRARPNQLDRDLP